MTIYIRINLGKGLNENLIDTKSLTLPFDEADFKFANIIKEQAAADDFAKIKKEAAVNEFAKITEQAVSKINECIEKYKSLSCPHKIAVADLKLIYLGKHVTPATLPTVMEDFLSRTEITMHVSTDKISSYETLKLRMYAEGNKESMSKPLNEFVDVFMKVIDNMGNIEKKAAIGHAVLDILLAVKKTDTEKLDMLLSEYKKEGSPLCNALCQQTSVYAFFSKDLLSYTKKNQAWKTVDKAAKGAKNILEDKKAGENQPSPAHATLIEYSQGATSLNEFVRAFLTVVNDLQKNKNKKKRANTICEEVAKILVSEKSETEKLGDLKTEYSKTAQSKLWYALCESSTDMLRYAQNTKSWKTIETAAKKIKVSPLESASTTTNQYRH